MGSSAAFAPGERLGRYEILAVLGIGGMGEVYRARDPDLGRDIALKVLPTELAGDPERLQRFRREAETLASIDHPGIVTVHSVEEADGIHFLTMALVEGSDLGELIPARGLPAGRFFPLAIALAEALTAAHERGVVHRDLKPGNVRVTPDGRLKVLDFGLAKQARAAGPPVDSFAETGAATRHGAVLGTVPYMAPEQARGGPADERSDVFSLGAVLYEMATGNRPFAGETPAELVSAILRDAPPPVDAVRSDVPHHLGRIVRRCLEKDPLRRYQSAREVANELADLERELGLERVEAPAVPARPERPRPRWAAWLAPPVLAAVAATAWWITVGGNRIGREDGGSVDRSRIRALAVLPFENLMRDPEQDYLVDGMHEALITDLSKIEPLRVISRTSAARYRGTEKSLPEIARELGVDALVEGSVLRSGDRVRITAQLIDGGSDEHLWAQSFDRDLEDLFALLSEVAEAISGEIEIALTPETRARPGRPAVSAEAQEAYLRGRHYTRTLGGREDYAQALRFYERALELEPTFAEAWAGKAVAHLFLGGLSHEAPQEHARSGREAAERSLELDPRQDDALAVRGWLAYYFDWDWESAHEDFERALGINPNHWGALHGVGEILTLLDRADEGVTYLRRAKDVDPLSPATVGPYIGHLLLAGRFEEVLAEAEKALAFDPDLPLHGWMAESLWALGRREEAIEEYRAGWAGSDEAQAALDRGAAEAGPRGALLELARLRAARAEAGGSPLSPAVLFAQCGEIDEAFRWLEEAYARRQPQLPTWLPTHPALEPLRSDPRYADLARRVGIPG